LAEILFYHLTASPLEASLPDMVARSLERDWRVLIRCGTEAGLVAVDAMLWTWGDGSFLPHGTEATGHGPRQPVWLTRGDDNPNGATVLMLVDGARAAPDAMAAFDRACLIFDGADPEAVAAARSDWKAVTAAGLGATYWAQEDGRWVRRAGT
jgi:DNA polymerase-3 subunit chi